LSSSTAPLRNGVTSATMEPWNLGRMIEPSVTRYVRERGSIRL
jgi:hypothetical protein